MTNTLTTNTKETILQIERCAKLEEQILLEFLFLMKIHLIL